MTSRNVSPKNTRKSAGKTEMRTPTATKRPRGRPKRSAASRETCSLECRLRAKEIHQQSLGNATPKAIAAQLAAEGFEPAPAAKDISAWRRTSDWSKPIHSPTARDASEALRQAVQLRVPDDLERIERSAMVLEALAQQSATWLAAQIEHVPITSAGDFEIMSRCVNELVRSQLLVGKSLQDLRQLRAAAAAGFGEIIPPVRDGERPASAQEQVISNF